MGKIHFETLRKLKEVIIVGICDKEKNRAEKITSGGDYQYFRDYTDLLNTDVDAIWVCTPDFTHTEICLKVLAAKKHLFVEKMLARTVSEGKKLVEAAKREKGIKTMVGFPLRFDPYYATIKDFLASKDIGKPLMVWSTRSQFVTDSTLIYDRYRDEYCCPPSWYFNRKKSGGPIFSFASHDYDLLQWYAGKIDTVFSYGDRYLNNGDVTDGYIVGCKFKSGATGYISTTWISRINFNYVGVTTEKATILYLDDKIVAKIEEKPKY